MDLILAEKPSQARAIAYALAANEKKTVSGVTYFVGKNIVVASAVGHLFTLEPIKPGWTYPKFEFDWTPTWKSKKGLAFVKGYFDCLKEIINEFTFSNFIIGCDFDIEGSLIGYIAFKMAGVNDEKMRRMKMQSLTKNEISRAYGTLSPPDFEWIEAGHARHQVDAIYGINLTTLMSKVVADASGRWKLVSMGRVQSPSIAGDEPILIKDNGKITIKSIGDFYAECNIHTKNQEGEVNLPSNKYFALSMNWSNLKSEWKPITSVYKHPLREDLFEITTRSGRQLKVSASHNLFELKNNKISPTKTSDLKRGSYICVIKTFQSDHFPTKINLIEEFSKLDKIKQKNIWLSDVELTDKNLNLGRKFLHHSVSLDQYLKNSGCFKLTNKSRLFTKTNKTWALPPEIVVNESFARLMGYYIAEGSKANGLCLSLGKSPDEYLILRDAIRCANKVFGFSVQKLKWHVGHYQDSCLSLSFGGVLLQRLFYDVWNIGVNKNKDIPDIVLALRPKLLIQFLKGYFAGDGYYNNAVGLACSTCSKKIANKLLYLLNRLNVFGTVLLQKRCRNSFSQSRFYSIKIGEKKYLKKLFEATPNRHKKNLKKNLIISNGKTTWELIPYNGIDTSKFPRVKGIKENKIGARREVLLKNTIDPFQKLLCDSDVIFDQIKNIKKIEAKDDVYDISVEGNENFVAGLGGVITHNTLKFVVDRERIINNFVPEKYWVITADLLINGQKYVATHKLGNIKDEKLARQIFEKCKDAREATVSDVNERTESLQPPLCFNLPVLQREAWRIFHFAPAFTDKLAQRLYQQIFTSYPRTETTVITGVPFPAILATMAKNSLYQNFVNVILSQKYQPRSGGISDGAHIALTPTPEPGEAKSSAENKLLDLIRRRFLATFYPPTKRKTTSITFNIKGEPFILSGTKTVEGGWLEPYQYLKLPEEEVPTVQQGDIVNVQKISLDEKLTKPPQRYTLASLIQEMAKNMIGTKATRSEICQKLLQREYIQLEKNTVKPTFFGMHLITVAEKYCPLIINVELTKDLEKDLEKIEKKQASRNEVVQKALWNVTSIIDQIEKKRKEIGAELASTVSVVPTKKRGFYRIVPSSEEHQG